jgi:hypothetical protein
VFVFPRLVCLAMTCIDVRAMSVIIVAFGLSGCIPCRFVDVPGFQGTVVSARDGQPIAAARVSIYMGRGNHQERGEGSVATSKDGTFAIEAKKYWGIYVIPMDFIGYLGTIEIGSPGFNTVRIPFRSSPVGKPDLGVGTVRLEPEAKDSAR